MRDIDYLELGGTLYVPAVHKNLKAILLDSKYDFLTSVVICFEDSIRDNDLQKAMQHFKNILQSYVPKKLKVFIRPRNIQNLKIIMSLKNIDNIDGFVLPKIDLQNIKNYFNFFKNDFYLMPTIEKILDYNELKELSKIFKEQNILSIRIGIEDILGDFGIVRESSKPYFDNLIMNNFIYILFDNFKKDFNVSAPVFPYFENKEILKQELKIEVELQIFNKTIIHPNQSKIINKFYKVSKQDLDIAKLLLEDKKAIFEVDKRMYEYATHKKWAVNLIKRAKIYGTK